MSAQMFTVHAQGSGNLRNLLCVGVAAAALQFAGPALAQEQSAQESTGAGDIVVTAQRREQRIDKVGISITAISGDQLSKMGVVDARGLAAQTPGLIFDGGSAQGLNAFVTIRGVSQVDFSEHQEMPNAVYLDDAYVPTTSMVAVPVYDMQRAEALRGPQGTLFGRNSTGGLLNFVTRDPGEELNGYGEVRYGNYNRVWTEGAVGGRVSENVSLRIAGFLSKGDGYYKNHNTTPGDNADAFEQDAWGLRGKLKYELGNWDITTIVSHNKSPKHVEGAYKTLPGYVDPATGTPSILPADLDFYGTGPGLDPLGYRDPYKSAYDGSFNSRNSYLEKEYSYGTVKIQGPLTDSVAFTSVTNYSRSEINYGEDSDSTPNEYFNFRSFGETRQFTQEFRLNGDTDKLNWTLGAYFLDIKGDYGTDFDFIIFDTLYPNRYEQETRSYAVFGQAEYQLTERLKATAGLRYTHDKKHFESVAFEIYPGCDAVYGEPTCQNYNFTDAAVGNLTTQKKGDVAGKIAIDFQVTPDFLAYASFSRGTRGPGFNATSDGFLPVSRTRFKNESVYASEVGAKVSLLDDIVNLRTSVFYYDYKDFQTFNFNGISSSVSNNDARMYGGEVEVYARPWKGANIGTGLSLLRAKAFDVTTGAGTADTEPVKAPHVTFNASFAQTVDVASYQLNFQYTVNYVGKHKANLAESEITDIPGSWIQNARLGLGQADGGWEVYGYVNNIFDKERKTFGYDNTFAGLALSSYAEPRMYGVGVRKEF